MLSLNRLKFNRFIRRWLFIVLPLLLSVTCLVLITQSRPKTPHKPWDPKYNGGPPEKAIVMRRRRGEDIQWAYDLAPEWETYAYTSPPEPEYLPLLFPRGRESLTYLTFIIDNYNHLPEYTAFIHAERDQPHNDVLGPSTAEILTHLRLDTVDQQGYVNFRCSPVPGCPVAINPLDPSEEDIKSNDTRAFFADIYMELFAVPRGKVPKSLGNVCCGQFAVSRKRILSRPKEDYERMRRWGMETTVIDDYGVGWVFEKVWHVMFGMDPIHCPTFEKCRCGLLGWCDEQPPEELREVVRSAHPWLGSHLGRAFGDGHGAGDWMSVLP